MERGAARESPRLLVIDDDEQVGITIGRIAQRAGYLPCVTSTFEEFKAAYDDSIRVIVVDLAMPEVDGIEVIRFLAWRSCRAGVVLASGLDRRVLASAVQLANDRGLPVLGSLGKPFGVHELLDLLSMAQAAVPGTTVPAREPPSAQELRQALSSNQICVRFQPKVDLLTRRLVGVEVVVRWQHPERGLIRPQAFVGLAEEEGLIEQLTYQVMLEAFAACAGWREGGLDVGVAVNLSSCCLSHIDLPDRIDRLAGSHGVETHHVVLELTESCISEDLVTAADILTRVRLKGFELSIDDFGTGYSTLQQLKRLPFNELKLDRSFVRAAPSDAEARAIVESSIELAHALALRVVAEGVESPEQWRLVAELSCDQAQGHIIAEPMRAEELGDWEQWWRSQDGAAASLSPS